MLFLGVLVGVQEHKPCFWDRTEADALGREAQAEVWALLLLTVGSLYIVLVSDACLRVCASHHLVGSFPLLGRKLQSRAHCIPGTSSCCSCGTLRAREAESSSCWCCRTWLCIQVVSQLLFLNLNHGINNIPVYL